MKIQFSCNFCGESFNIDAKYLITKSSVICPNCSSKFPEGSFSDLKEGIQLIYKCQKDLPLQDLNHDYTTLMDFKFIY